MEYKITTEQINAVLTTVYQTNISASSFDALKKFLSELPTVIPPVDKPVEKVEKK